MKKLILAIVLGMVMAIQAMAQHKDTANLTIIVNAPLALTTTSLPPATAGVLYTLTISASGGTTPYTFSFPNNVAPPGAAITSAGVFTWTPTSAQVGNSSLSFMVKDAKKATATKSYTITVNSGATPLAITTTSLPAGTVGTAYSATMTATGGAPPYAWSATGLPPGLAISTTGVITGTPTTAGTYSGAITVTDSSATVARLTFSITTATTALHSVSVTWTNSVTPGVTGYNVLWSTVSGGPYAQLNGALVTAQPFTHSNLPAGQQECYVVKASGAGSVSVASNESCCTTPSP